MPSLLTTSQARWGLAGLVGLLSVIAIASSAPPSAGGEAMYSGTPGDIRGLIVIMGASGLVGVGVMRALSMLVPTVWRVYLDRLEFTLVAMLLICWTSATMAFSAFTLDQGICSFSVTIPEIILPTCPLLTSDLTLLHLLSTASLVLLLVILSSALSTNYLSSLDSESCNHAGKRERRDALVMWELALASAPPSPRLNATNVDQPIIPAQYTYPYLESARSYGTSSPTTPLIQSYQQLSRSNQEASYAHATLQVPDDSQDQSSSSSSTTSALPPRWKDKFAEGRLRTYIPLALCSFGAAGASMIALRVGEFAYSGIFLFVIAVYSLFFSIACREAVALLRKERALEVGAAGALFILWPFAAVLYTSFPTTPNRPCANPAASSIPHPGEDLGLEHAELLCTLSWSVVTVSWLAAWIVLTRVMGLVFPMPNVNANGLAQFSTTHSETTANEEGRSLLRDSNKNSVRRSNTEGMPQRPQLGWGRIVAGEAFELGEDFDGDADNEDDGGGLAANDSHDVR